LSSRVMHSGNRKLDLALKNIRSTGDISSGNKISYFKDLLKFRKKKESNQSMGSQDSSKKP
jgi:hypothetical protein